MAGSALQPGTTWVTRLDASRIFMFGNMAGLCRTMNRRSGRERGTQALIALEVQTHDTTRSVETPASEDAWRSELSRRGEGVRRGAQVKGGSWPN